ncbi:hypothetical protein ABBQ38_000342 [Trebouxia sp. C0009 RCD-2024]
MFACKSAAAVLLAAAIIPLLVTARLSADVVPSNVTASGEDWCQPLAPCNQPKASVESFLDVAFGLIPKASSGTEKYEYADVTPAAAVDWRKVLTNWTIRDQGSCYAFAAAGALETLVAIDREANAVSELSEADLVECQSSDSYGCDSSGSSCNGCNGGDPTLALGYALKQQGLPSAVDYPYSSLVSADTAGTCQNNVTAKGGTSFMSVQRVPTTTLALKQAVTMQPVAVGVDASDWSQSYYADQGIYSGDCTSNTVNHALMVVGYNKMSSGEEYWILRNQWGPDWGADGYIYLPINSDDDKTGGACGLLGVQNGFPPVYPSTSASAPTSGALSLQTCGVLVLAALSAMLLVSV